MAALLSEIKRRIAPEHNLLEIAILVNANPEMIPLLGDAIIESGWKDDRVACLCLGVPLDPVPPDTIYTREGRSLWHQRRRASIEFAADQWDIYAPGARRDFARAVLAVLLFRDWSFAKKTPSYGSRSPWLLVWRTATEPNRAIAAQQRAQRRERMTAAVAAGRVA